MRLAVGRNHGQRGDFYFLAVTYRTRSFEPPYVLHSRRLPRALLGRFVINIKCKQGPTKQVTGTAVHGAWHDTDRRVEKTSDNSAR